MPITVDVDEIFGDLIAERVNRSAQAALDKGLREGLEKGREEGIEKGREQGAFSLLHRQIANRFGPLPEWAEERLKSLSAGQLEDISIRVLNATSLDQLFAQQ
jgi:flagellar biosynthesis/type III secretory pathway protein FliH